MRGHGGHGDSSLCTECFQALEFLLDSSSSLRRNRIKAGDILFCFCLFTY